MFVKNRLLHCPNYFIFIFFLVLFLVGNDGCSSFNSKLAQELNKNDRVNKKNSDEYERYLKLGTDYIANKEFKKAEESFRKALEIAENADWINEIVSAKTKIANVYMFKREYAKSELAFNEAIETCEDNDKCSADRLDVTFGFLAHLYLFQMKDISKAYNLIGQIKSSRVFASSGKTGEKVCHYINKIKDAGYEKEAEALSHRESCYP